jgi:hypothetical protein
MRTLCLLTVVGVFAIFFFSWLPRPDLASYKLLPDWLSSWTDNNNNMNVRTAVPFFLLGLTVGIWLIIAEQTWNVWFLAWLALTGTALIAELGQLFLPKRHFDWGDVIWGGTGAGASLLLVALLNTVVKYTQRKI